METGFTDEQRARFRALRLRHLEGDSLSQEETLELARYVAKAESREAAAMQRSQERQEQRIAELDRRAAELRTLIARREALLDYLKGVRQKVSREESEIEAAFTGCSPLMRWQ